MPASQNTWPANDRTLTKQWTIPGTSRKITLEKGDAGFLLCHFASWFDKYVEDIDPEGQQLDDWGYAERPIRGSTTTLSNHASGTAIDLNALKHPLGVANSFTDTQAAKIRAKLHDYEGCIRWGGDYSGRKDEMHFEINAPASKVAQVAAKLRGMPDTTSGGENMLIPMDVPAGSGTRRFVIPTGKESTITARAWLSAAVDGPSTGRIRLWCQSRTGGINDTGGWRNIGFRDGRSDVFGWELPSGTVQVNVHYEFPNGGTFTIETLAK